ncbi:MAG: hypothetical protein KGH69_05535, partial [Candidatus Micrarchaeota archaeon]|nr:hypothetical protein [Candidatus Micrarchaeota archaeon]
MSKALRFVSRIAPTVLTAAGVIYLVYMIISSSPSAKAGLLSYIYCVGSSGYSPENLSYYAKASSAGVSDWIATSSYPVGVDDAGCSIYRNYIYCVGTNATEQENQTYYAPISGSGIGKWIATTPYPIKFWLAGCS